MGCAFTTCSFFSTAADLKGQHPASLSVMLGSFYLQLFYQERVYCPGDNASIAHLEAILFEFLIPISPRGL